ncbi:alpha/beta hydrolase [Caulobacter sp. 1776]|uniref:alpha/beta hydrolase n=1 Tax=Caulobacter sp. 1776 TaxID=3156420 RepID=UPI0033912D1A
MSLNVIVLVHGYFLDSSAWRKVIPLLAERGLEAVAVRLTLNSLSEDTAIVQRAIEMQSRPVLLVGQSYGGAVITQAGNHAQVKGLVYVAAAAPDSGQSVDDWWSGYATAAVTEELRPYKDDRVALSRDGVRKYLAQDLSTKEADIIYATQGPFGARTTQDLVTHSAWRDKPAWYVVTTLDHTVPPATQQDSAERMGAEILVLQSSHVPMLSQPQAVADFIANAAASFGE